MNSESSSRTSVKVVSIMIKPGVEEILSNPREWCAGNATQVEKTYHSHKNTT
jgi:hypothetical protein